MYELQKQNFLHALSLKEQFYKNKLRTIEARLQIQM